MSYQIKVIWDADAAVWVATSEDVPGLAIESGSFDVLIEKLHEAVPELIELNGEHPKEYRLHYATERTDLVAAYG